MANGGRRRVAPVRRIIAWVLGTVAVFITLFGAGSGSWAIAALGIALLVLAISLVVVSAVRGGARAWVAGSAHVVSASEPPASSTFGRCELQVVIDAPGLPAAAVKIIDPRVPVAKWPDVGVTLPIMVAVDDPRHVRIQWDEVLTHTEAAAQEEFGEPEIVIEDLYFDPNTPRRAPTVDVDERVVPTETVAVPVDEAPPATPPSSPEPSFAPGGPEPAAAPGGPEPAAADVTASESGTAGPPPKPVPRPRKPSPRPSRRRGPDGDASPSATAAAPPSPPNPPAQPAASNQPAQPTASNQPAQPTASNPPASPDPPTASNPPTAPDPPSAAAPTATAAAAAAGAATAGAAAAARRGRTVMVERPAGGAPPPRRPFDDVFPAVADAEDDDALAERITTYPSARPGPTGSIHGVGVTVLVTDLARSIAFYQDMLGFHAIDTGEGNAVLASGDTRLVLRRIHDVAPVNRRMVHLNLEVGNLQAVYDGLKARGVKFTYGPRPVNRGERLELWAAAFRDPDGHGIALTQWKGRPAERMGSAAADSGGSAEDAAPDVQHVRPDEGKHDPDRRQRPMQKPGEQ